MRILALSAALLALSACAQVSGDITADATSAQAIATVTGRTQDIPCLQAIAAMSTASAGVKPPAVLTTTEIALGAQGLAEGPCAPLIGAVAVTVLQHAPIPVPVP